MVAPVGKKLFTVSEYHKLADVGILKPTDQVELINGEIIQMSPIRSYHSSIVDELAELLILALSKKAIIKIQNPIQLDNLTEPEPDLVIAKKKIGKYRNRHPRPKDLHLVIEVSDSTLRYDRKTKARLYAKANIPEYWIINLQDDQIEVYSQPKDGKYQIKDTKKEGDTVNCRSINFNLIVDDLFA